VLLNTRHIAELIEKGEINEIKEALEKSMSPGSQTFEQALFKLFMDGKITQEEAMANADSATNMLWLINQATAGEISGRQSRRHPHRRSPQRSRAAKRKRASWRARAGVVQRNQNRHECLRSVPQAQSSC